MSFGAMMTTRPATERVEWEAPLRRGEVDRCGLGVIDERAKQFSPAERRIAEYLAVKGPAARYAVIDARDSRLTEDDAQRGIRRFSGTPTATDWTPC